MIAVIQLQPSSFLNPVFCVFFFVLDFIFHKFVLLSMSLFFVCVSKIVMNLSCDTLYHAFLHSQMSKVDIFSYKITSSSKPSFH